MTRAALDAPRAAVAVVCPFAGTLAEGASVLERLSGIERRDGDRLVLVDNTAGHVLAPLAAGTTDGTVVLSAPLAASSYYARNVGAESAGVDWLLFLDADCLPVPGILDEYFAEAVPDECGAIAGGVSGAAFQPGLLTRYARARGILDQARFTRSERPFAATANLLVRRAAWEQVGGFCEGIRSGGDVDFSWRLQDAGWTLLYRPAARVEHVHRESLRGLVRQFARYGAGRAWLQRRHPDAPPASRHTKLLIAAPALIVGLAAIGRPQRAAFRAIDVAIVLANRLGRLLENRSASRAAGRSSERALVAGPFPEPAALAAYRELARGMERPTVEASRRSSREPARLAREFDVVYAEDDGPYCRWRDLAWLSATRPQAVLRDLLARERRDRTPLRHLAPPARRLAGSGVRELLVAEAGDGGSDAQRLARLLGIPCSSLDGR